MPLSDKTAVQEKYAAAKALLHRNRARDAMDALDAITREHPDFPPALNDFGVLLVHAGQFERAIPYLSRVWDLTLHPEAARSLAVALRSAGKKEYAVQALQSARRDFRLDAPGFRMLSELLYEIGKIAELAEVIEQWCEMMPDELEPKLRMLEVPALATHALRAELSTDRPAIEEFVSALSVRVPAAGLRPRVRPADPRITIGIPTRNRREPLYVTLSSIARQTYRNFEVLISDDSEELGLEEELQRIFPDLNIRYVRGLQVSLPANRAHIFMHTTGEYVVMCDDDHYMLPDCLELLVNSMREHPDAGIVSAVWPHPLENPKTIVFEEKKHEHDYRLDLGDVGPADGFWWKNGCEMFKAYCTSWPVLESEFAGGGCLLYRRSAVMSVGGFPRECSFVSFREDTDMSHRLFLAGYRNIIQTGALAYHMRATDGGCRDGKSWGERLVRDGLGFLERLKVWRAEADQRKTLKAEGPIRLAISTADPVARRYWEDQIKLCGTEIQFAEAAEASDTQVLAVTVPGEPGEIVTVFTPADEKCAIELLKFGKALGVVTPVLSIAEAHLTEREWAYLPQVEERDDTITACWIGETERELLAVEDVCREFGFGLRAMLLPQARAAGAEQLDAARKELMETCSVLFTFSAPTFVSDALAAGLEVITSPAYARDFEGARISIAEAAEASLREAVTNLVIRWLDAGGSLSNVADPAGARTTVVSVMREIERRKRFGVTVRAEVDEKTVARLVEENFSDRPRRSVDSYIVRREGKIIELSPDFLPRSAEGYDQFVKQLITLGPFHFHYGGAGDGLLLLSTFYDVKPHSTILCCATSPRAMEAFFKEFPELDKVYLIELPEDEMTQGILRAAMSMIPNLISRGATPLRSHDDEWLDGIDITSSYGIQLYPTWIPRFQPLSVAPRQVTVSPKGSCLHMTDGKANALPPEIWPEVVRILQQNGCTPVILGTPEEHKLYPALPGTIDKRSYSFSEQMRLINGSELFVGADSWSKTFSAMAGKPTIVFAPTVDGAFTSLVDVSVNVFVRPWKNITLVKGVAELAALFSKTQSTALQPDGISA